MTFFAVAALQGLLSRDVGRNVSTTADYESRRAVTAYRLAYEMLKARQLQDVVGAIPAYRHPCDQCE
nr:hypothetical protein [Burkholderia ambifaria]